MSCINHKSFQKIKFTFAAEEVHPSVDQIHEECGGSEVVKIAVHRQLYKNVMSNVY